MNRPNADAINALKTAMRVLVNRLGGIEAAASCTRVSKTQIADYYAPLGERFVPVDVVLDLELVADLPLVTAALARAQGCELVPVTARAPGELAVLLARIGRDASTLFADAAEVLGGKALTGADRTRLAADLDELRLAAGDALAALQPDRGVAHG